MYVHYLMKMEKIGYVWKYESQNCDKNSYFT